MTSSVSRRLKRSERNSWPRTGMSPSQGIFEMSCTLFCSRPAEDKALTAPEFDRRFGAAHGQRGNLRDSLTVHRAGRAQLAHTGADFQDQMSGSMIVGVTSSERQTS